MSIERLVLFIDAQNVYRGARNAFEPDGAIARMGQVDPMALARLICGRPPPGVTRTLEAVRVYSGRPDSTKQPKAYGAHMRQCAAWASAGVVVVPRTLRYPFGYPAPGLKPQEKGVDVALAIDYVMFAVENRYDVGVIFSTDTDLRPALEAVAQRYHGTPKVETAAWNGPGFRSQLRLLPPRNNWCHLLDASDYQSVADPTDYNL